MSALRRLRLRVTPLHSRRYRAGDRIIRGNRVTRDQWAGDRGTVTCAPEGIRDGFRWLHVTWDDAPINGAVIPASQVRPA